MNTIRVGKPEIIRGNKTTRVQSSITGHELPPSLWFEVPNSYARYLETTRADWVYSSLLMPAMIRGAGLVIDSLISEKLHYSSENDLQYVLCKQNSQLRRISVQSHGYWNACDYPKGPAVGLGFSAGVDAFSAVIRNLSIDIPSSYKITHLTTLNVGALPKNDSDFHYFNYFLTRSEEFANFLKLNSLGIDSNLSHFYQGIDFQKSHTIRNISAILVLQSLFFRYYYSSTFEYSSVFIGPTYDISYADPIILNHLSTEYMEFLSSGSQYSRLEKVEMVSTYPPSYMYLDVCVENYQNRIRSKYANCSSCWKCGRQMLTLDLLDKLKCYEKVFDIEKYNNNRSHHIGIVLATAYKRDQPNDRDVSNLIFQKCGLELLSNKLFSKIMHYTPTRLLQFFGKILNIVLKSKEKASVKRN